VALYGPRLERVVLFGSRARGDARPDSDYDVAVFLVGVEDRWAEMDRLTRLSTDILDETGAVINALPFSAGAYRERTPLMHEIRQDGRDL
jgi:predicted nucleotidyltransferase